MENRKFKNLFLGSWSLNRARFLAQTLANCKVTPGNSKFCGMVLGPQTRPRYWSHFLGPVSWTGFGTCFISRRHCTLKFSENGAIFQIIKLSIDVHYSKQKEEQG